MAQAMGPPPRKIAPRAIVALVLGVLSLSCGLFAGIPAIYVADSARRQVDMGGGRYSGEELATAAKIIGTVTTLLSLPIVALVLFFRLA